MAPLWGDAPSDLGARSGAVGRVSGPLRSKSVPLAAVEGWKKEPWDGLHAVFWGDVLGLQEAAEAASLDSCKCFLNILSMGNSGGEGIACSW